MAKNNFMVNAERTALLLQGIAAIVFGILAVFWPGLTAKALAYLFAAFLLADGVIALVWGLLRRNRPRRAALVIAMGLLELAAGLFLVRSPGIGFAAFILILGFMLLARGAFSFAHAFAGSGQPTLRTMHALLGVLGAIVGIFVLAQPAAGGLAFVWLLGLYALIAGPVLIALSADLGKNS